MRAVDRNVGVFIFPLCEGWFKKWLAKGKRKEQKRGGMNLPRNALLAPMALFLCEMNCGEWKLGFSLAFDLRKSTNQRR